MSRHQRVLAGAEMASTPSLWLLAAAPTLWALHFLACYLTAAVWCARGDGALGGVRAAIAGFTGIALVGIGVVALIAARWQSQSVDGSPHDLDVPRDRTAFLGLASLLLAALSAVAVVYVAAVALFFETCR